MIIKPVVSNSVIIEHNGIELTIHCGDNYINVKSDSDIEFPKKINDLKITYNDTVCFSKKVETIESLEKERRKLEEEHCDYCEEDNLCEMCEEGFKEIDMKIKILKDKE